MKASKEGLEVQIQKLLDSGEHEDSPLSAPLRELWTAAARRPLATH